MRVYPPDATSQVTVRERLNADTDLHSSGECDAPTPLQMFTRLGVLLVIALAFGLVAQFFGRHAPLTDLLTKSPLVHWDIAELSVPIASE